MALISANRRMVSALDFAEVTFGYGQDGDRIDWWAWGSQWDLAHLNPFVLRLHCDWPVGVLSICL